MAQAVALMCPTHGQSSLTYDQQLSNDDAIVNVKICTSFRYSNTNAVAEDLHRFV